MVLPQRGNGNPRGNDLSGDGLCGIGDGLLFGGLWCCTLLFHECFKGMGKCLYGSLGIFSFADEVKMVTVFEPE